MHDVPKIKLILAPSHAPQCSCVSGFTGKDCEINIDDCTPASCGLHGVCNDGINNFTCSCHADYTGRFCQNKIDDCIGTSRVFGFLLNAHTYSTHWSVHRVLTENNLFEGVGITEGRPINIISANARGMIGQ